MLLSHIDRPQFKSPLPTIVRSLVIGREKKNDRLQQAKTRIERLETQNQRLINENRSLRGQLDRAGNQIAAPQPTLISIPDDVSPKRHNFGARFIAMCCELSKAVGFRAAENVLEHVRHWLGSDFTIPDWTTIRSWLCRIGVAILDEELEKADDWIWLADHSVQLGDMKVFVILGIRQHDLPEGRPLRRTDMQPLAVVPSIHRNQHEVASQFTKLADRVGVPISIVIDGATELHEGAKCFSNAGKDVVILDDIKHKAANILKKLIGRSERFQQFESHLGKTTARIQQTELAAFLPPKKKEKCRFMNLSKLLRWAEMTLDHLIHKSAAESAPVDPERLEQKLGWLRTFADDLVNWQACQELVSVTLELTAASGIYRGITSDLNEHLDATLASQVAATSKVRACLVEVVSDCEHRLLKSSYADQKLIASTEVLESLFGGFKRLQRDQTRGTFTSLLSCLPALTSSLQPDRVKRYLENLSNAQLHDWLKRSGLKNSTQAQRRKAYHKTRSRKKQEPRHKNTNSLAKS